MPEAPKYEAPAIEVPTFEPPKIPDMPAPAPPPAETALALAKKPERAEGPGRTAGRSTKSPTVGRKGTQSLRVGLTLPSNDGPSGLQIPKG